MEKLILKGLTEYAYKHLLEEDIEDLENLIGTEIVLDEEISVYGGNLYRTMDGETCHEDFIIIDIIDQ